MALIDYSDSEGSDQEASAKTTTVPAKPRVASNRPAFQKLVDSSNPHKIRVDLTEQSKQETKETNGNSEPPAKRVKLGGGALNDFNSLLPAPKRSAATNGLVKGGLGRGVNLKTAAAPGFSREPWPERDSRDEGLKTGNEILEPERIISGSRIDDAQTEVQALSPHKALDEQPIKKATMFKPLSVARKPQKKKPPFASTVVGSLGTASVQGKAAESKMPPKLSLFPSVNALEDHSVSRDDTSKTSGIYEPMLYHVDGPNLAQPAHPDQPDLGIFNPGYQDPTLTEPGLDQHESLEAVASSLNLSASARRQLLGRNANKSQVSAIKIANFNTDEEYAANEALRQAGEAVQHNAVRAIAPGKHSLKSLVNAATSQKDALEESFAEGRRNKKEAGGRYGW